MIDERPYYIYELVDPRTNAICYVGITVRPEVRYAQHCYAQDTNIAKCGWVKELAVQGLKPIMNILETVEGDTAARKRERYWMQTYVSQGLHLLNIKDMPDWKPSRKHHLYAKTERPYTKTANALRRDILSGCYRTEGKIPTNKQLMEKYSVSVNTVLNAMHLLEGEGLIVQHGQRYFVNQTYNK